MMLATLLALAALAAAAPDVNLSGVAPDTVRAGTPEFRLTVDGGVFTPGSVVRWNGSPRTTTFVSPSRLTAVITAADVARAGSARVDVRTDGSSSNALPVAVTGSAAPRGSSRPRPAPGPVRYGSARPAPSQRQDRPEPSVRRIVFDRLEPGSSLVVSAQDGRTVAELPAPDGTAVWELAEGARAVEPGVYRYRVYHRGRPSGEGVVAVMR